MTKETFTQLNLEFKNYRSDFKLACWTLFKTITFTSFAVILSYSGQLYLLVIGQIFLGLMILQWFVLLHDFGHNHYFKSELANTFWGVIASLFCLVPFSPWKSIHAKHHTWTGWQDKDPTMETSLSIKKKKHMWPLAKIVWALGIPAITLMFSFKNFWNIKKLFILFSDKKLRIEFVFSIVFLLVFIFLVIPTFPHFLYTWLPAYIFFLVISDPLLLSQHTHVPQNLSHGTEVRPFPVYEQDIYTRELKFPNWVSTYILLNFDKHTTHHIWPNIPCYNLGKLIYIKEPSISAFDWFIQTKRLPGDKLLFQNRKETGWTI